MPDFPAAIGGDLKGLKIGVLRHFHEVESPASGPTVQALDAYEIATAWRQTRPEPQAVRAAAE